MAVWAKSNLSDDVQAVQVVVRAIRVSPDAVQAIRASPGLIQWSSEAKISKGGQRETDSGQFRSKNQQRGVEGEAAPASFRADFIEEVLFGGGLEQISTRASKREQFGCLSKWILASTSKGEIFKNLFEADFSKGFEGKSTPMDYL